MSTTVRLARAASAMSSIYKIIFVTIMTYELLKRTFTKDSNDPHQGNSHHLGRGGSRGARTNRNERYT